MSAAKPQPWFQARLRWGLLEKGRGLDAWREAEHISISQDRETAFQEALPIGYAEEHSLIAGLDRKDAPRIDCRFTAVVCLDEVGREPSAFEVDLGERPGLGRDRIRARTPSLPLECRPRCSDRAFSVTPASAPP